MATLGLVLSIVGGLGLAIFGIQILISAFKTSTGWGLASLLLPFAVFVYVAKHWSITKTPFLRWVASVLVVAVGSGLSLFGAFSSASVQ